MRSDDGIPEFLSRAAASAQQSLDHGDFSRALTILHDAVEYVITDARTVSDYYGDAALDALCAEIGNRVFKEFPPPATTQVAAERYVYIATKLQRSGGHTRVLCDYIRARPNAHHVILLTGSEGRSDEAWLSETLGSITHFSLLRVPHGNPLNALRFLQAQLVALAPTHIYLFNHHADSVAVAAVAPSMRLPASFCHHGDHHLCLGVSSPHLTHLDLHPMGYHHCRERLGIANRYIPLVANATAVRDAGSFMANGTLTTATAGRSNKLEQPYPIRYVALIPELLAATGGTHIHIGSLSKRGLAHIHRGLKAHGIAPQRFVYIPWVTSVADALINHQVDLYIASFPYGGGLTLIETMGAGIPSTSHRHLFHRALGGFDLAYEGAFSWRDPAALIAYCRTLTPETLVTQHRTARAFYERYHRHESLKEWLEPDATALPVPPLQDYVSDESARDAWRTNASSPRSLTRLFCYRLYRRARHLAAIIRT